MDAARPAPAHGSKPSSAMAAKVPKGEAIRSFDVSCVSLFRAPWFRLLAFSVSFGFIGICEPVLGSSFIPASMRKSTSGHEYALTRW